MQTRTVLAVVVSLLAAGGALTLVASGVGPGGPGLADGSDLAERWVSDTGVPVAGNHHEVAAGRVGGDGIVVVPVSGEAGTDQCRVVALDAADGSQRWERPIPREECNIHAVGSLALADHDADGTPEALAPTGEERLYALDPASGEPELVFELPSYGYGRPAVGAFGPQRERRIVAVDAGGAVASVRPDGTTVWTREGASDVWANPTLADVAGDGEPEAVVGFGEGYVVAFGADGTSVWNRSLPGDGWLTWLATGDVTGEGRPDVVVSTDEGGVHALSGTDGAIRWSRSFGRLAAVGPVGDADGDGSAEAFVTAADGRLRSLDAATGRTEWAIDLAGDPGQMTPPPVAGDLDGDGAPEVVTVTNTGRVQVVAPADGRVLATYARGGPFPFSDEAPPVWTRPTLADADGDGAAEVYVVYGDGRVAALEYRP